MSSNWDKYFLDMCIVVAKNTKCISRQIGAVLTMDKKIISTGYNGPPAGIEPCDIRCMKDANLIEELNKKDITPMDALHMKACPRRILGIPSGEGLELCLHGNTNIKLLNGTVKTIEELTKENKDTWVYSVDVNTGEIVPAIATNFRKTGYKNNIVEVIFDNNKSIYCTHDHLLLLRNGEYKEAGKLNKNDRLMPIRYNYHDYESITNYGFGNFQKNRGISSTFSIQTEELVYRYINKDYRKLGNDYVIHHINENKLDNEPNNLVLMTRSEHSKYHGKNTPREYFVKIGKMGVEKQKENPEKYLKDRKYSGHQSMMSNWKQQKFQELMKPICIENGKKTAIKTNIDPEIIKKRSIGRIINGISNLIDRSKENINESNYEKTRLKYLISTRTGDKGANAPKYETILKYFNSINEAIDIALNNNHKVKKVNKLNITIPVYDMEVPKFNNFAIDLGDNSGIFAHNCPSIHAEKNCLLAAASNGTSTKGTTLYMNAEIVSCTQCFGAMINAGVKELVLIKKNIYDITNEWVISGSNIKIREFDI